MRITVLFLNRLASHDSDPCIPFVLSIKQRSAAKLCIQKRGKRQIEKTERRIFCSTSGTKNGQKRRIWVRES